jgi:hypothetical protein
MMILLLLLLCHGGLLDHTTNFRSKKKIRSDVPNRNSKFENEYSKRNLSVHVNILWYYSTYFSLPNRHCVVLRNCYQFIANNSDDNRIAWDIKYFCTFDGIESFLY